MTTNNSIRVNADRLNDLWTTLEPPEKTKKRAEVIVLKNE
ncbi:hypothetical protein FRUB_01187 [Fimbriiglobus ruber]|uniref:Uncharacterized protein n=1 Tax=Fimbriiglobus ruber TaxID=1908690 RepID=A0A225E9S7_9BACT|nr:hypothetical protein FRUB_01187 [Fimbriiglobus ruber]